MNISEKEGVGLKLHQKDNEKLGHPLDCPCGSCKEYVKQIEARIKTEKLAKEKERSNYVPFENCSFCGKTRNMTGRKTFGKTEDFNKYCIGCLNKSNVFKSKYNMTLEQYRAIMFEQKGRCAICNILLCEGGLGYNSPTVDHCHESEHVRGVLCARCNKGLGQFKDSIEALRMAIFYLIKNKIKRIWWRQRKSLQDGYSVK